MTRCGAIDNKSDTARSGAGQTTGGDHNAGFDTTARAAVTGAAHVVETEAGVVDFVGRAGRTRSTTSADGAKPP